MKLQSRLLVPGALASALGVLGMFGGGRCVNGYCVSIPVFAAQQGAARGPVTATRDPELEKQSLKSLDAARFYFTRRKPGKDDPHAEARIKAIEDRLREILDTYPQFSKVDQVYYLLGEVYNKLGNREEAIKYLSLVVNEFKDSEDFKAAKKRLDELQSQPGKKAEKNDQKADNKAGKKEGKKEN
jgi:tetratricopeptide (TPR) repeat protein